MKSYTVHFWHHSKKYKTVVLAHSAGKALDMVLDTIKGAQIYKVES